MIEFEGLRLSIFHVDFQDVRQEEKRVSLVKRNEKSVGWSRRRQKDKNRRQENTARRTLQLQKWESFIFGSQRVSLCTRWDFFFPHLSVPIDHHLLCKAHFDWITPEASSLLSRHDGWLGILQHNRVRQQHWVRARLYICFEAAHCYIKVIS